MRISDWSSDVCSSDLVNDIILCIARAVWPGFSDELAQFGVQMPHTAAKVCILRLFASKKHVRRNAVTKEIDPHQRNRFHAFAVLSWRVDDRQTIWVRIHIGCLQIQLVAQQTLDDGLHMPPLDLFQLASGSRDEVGEILRERVQTEGAAGREG